MLHPIGADPQVGLPFVAFGRSGSAVMRLSRLVVSCVRVCASAADGESRPTPSAPTAVIRTPGRGDTRTIHPTKTVTERAIENAARNALEPWKSRHA